MHGRPCDERHFLHKKIFGAISTVAGILPIPGGNLISKVTGALAGRTQPTQPTALVTTAGMRAGGNGGACPPGLVMAPDGHCVAPGSGHYRQHFGGPCPPGTPGCPDGAADFGAAVHGQYGVALEPAVRQTSTRTCPRGAVLGNDGLCYNRKQIKNSDREWPRGRRPMLTGGEVRAISIAHRAAGRVAGMQKRLREMGMLPPPPKARSKKQPQLPPAHHAHVAHN